MMSPEEEIDQYLRGERISAALRLLWIGAITLVLGSVGTLLVYRWWINGGVLPRIVLAGPLLLLVGVPVTGYGFWSLLRAHR
jgi:high-affinity Fe2+/Pb2+ permease